MPPTRQSDRVAKSRQTDLPREADRVLLRRPQRVLWHRLLDAKPIPPRRRMPGPVKARVIGEDLNAGADDEDHEEGVEEVLPPGPGRKPSCRLRMRGRQRAGIPADEPLHRRLAA